MNITVTAKASATTGTLEANGKSYDCVLGRTGILAEKREGDGGTPVGTYPLRRVYYRPDRVTAPKTGLPTIALTTDMGWCDDPADPHYNQPVTLPFTPSHEELWRYDHVYDLIVVIGHNDAPPVAGAGSAIFMHLQKPEKTPTAGCVAMTESDLRDVLQGLTADSTITINLI